MTFLLSSIKTKWTDYTPTFSTENGDASIGNGDLWGYWRRVGYSIEVIARVRFQSTTVLGTGPFNLSIPENMSINTDITDRLGGFVGPGYALTSLADAVDRSSLVTVVRGSNQLGGILVGSGSPAESGFPITWDTDYSLFLFARFPTS